MEQRLRRTLKLQLQYKEAVYVLQNADWQTSNTIENNNIFFYATTLFLLVLRRLFAYILIPKTKAYNYEKSKLRA